jgi:beta-N-acetylhexosaminidase
MSALARTAARCFVVGIQGRSPSLEELELVRRGIGGVVLFARNVESPAQVAELSRRLKAEAPGPLLLSIDQEGGRVQRLRPPHWTALPPLRLLGRLHAETGRGLEIAARLGALVAGELAACGLDQDYAPVLDVDTNPANPVIGDRSLGADPAVVASLGCAFGLALERAGVASCGKHFPGHGDTLQDSHKTLPRLPHGLERLRACELLPFAAAARAGLASVMTAHVIFSAFGDEPATLSSAALRLLRQELGYSGACLSDDLEMAAVAEQVGVVEGAVRAIAAGCDGVLVCHTLRLQHEAIDAVVRAAETGRLPAARLEEASGRMERLLGAFARPASAIDPSSASAACGSEAARAWVESLSPAAVGAAADPDPTERQQPA